MKIVTPSVDADSSLCIQHLLIKLPCLVILSRVHGLRGSVKLGPR